MFYGSKYFTNVSHEFHLDFCLSARCVDYWSSIFSSGYPILMRYSRTLSRWSPWSIMSPFLEVPPHAQNPFSFCARLGRFELLSSIPSIMVLGLPNFLVSSLMRIRCCSFSISPQTHKSFGSPQVEQTSAMTLILSNVTDIYKTFK